MNPRGRLRRVSRPATQVDEVLTVFRRRRKREGQGGHGPPTFHPAEARRPYLCSCSPVFLQLLGGIPYTYKTSRQKTFAKRLAVAFGVERSRAWLEEYVRALFAELAHCATDNILRKNLLRYCKIREIREFLGNCDRHVIAFVGSFIPGTIAKEFVFMFTHQSHIDQYTYQVYMFLCILWLSFLV